MKWRDSLWVLVAGLGVGCGGAQDTSDSSTKAPLHVSASPAGFMFESATTVELNASRHAQIFYTLNGDDPIGPTAIVYDQPIQLEESTLITFIAVSDDKTWSAPKAEFYESAPPDATPAHLLQRGLDLDENNHFFSPRPGETTNLEATFRIKSVGVQRVHINRISIDVNPAGRSFFEDGVFTLDNKYQDIDLEPGSTLAVTVHYNPTQTLRSAALLIDSDELTHTVDNPLYAQLWGRIIAW
jgi:Fn3 domain-containing protein